MTATAFHVIPFVFVFNTKCMHTVLIPKIVGWFLAQAVKFPLPRSAQVKEPSVKISFIPSQDFAPL